LAQPKVNFENLTLRQERIVIHLQKLHKV